MRAVCNRAPMLMYLSRQNKIYRREHYKLPFIVIIVMRSTDYITMEPKLKGEKIALLWLVGCLNKTLEIWYPTLQLGSSQKENRCSVQFKIHHFFVKLTPFYPISSNVLEGWPPPPPLHHNDSQFRHATVILYLITFRSKV